MSKPTGNWEDDCNRDDTAKFIRTVPKADPKLPVIERLRLIVKESTANRIDGVFVDLFSASVAVQVYDAVNEANKAKLAGLPVRRLISVCFQVVNKKGAA